MRPLLLGLMAALVFAWPAGALELGGIAAPTTTRAKRSANVFELVCRGTSCSDGRPIVTTRTGPVPCQSQPGVITYPGTNQACVNWRGETEVWGQNQTLISFGSDLAGGVWAKSNLSVTALPGGGFTLTKQTPELRFASNERAALVANSSQTAACIVKPRTATQVAIDAIRAKAATIVTLSEGWQTVSDTKTGVAGDVPGVSVGPAAGAVGDSIDVLGCWNAAASTPGRACWPASGGAVPFSCNADVHAVDTTGFPTDGGEVSVTWKLEEACPSGQLCVIFDGRTESVATAPNVSIGSTGLLQLGGIGTTLVFAAAQVGVAETLRWKLVGGLLSVWRNGVLVVDQVPRSAMAWGATARLGSRYSNEAWINGSWSSLRVKTYTGGTCTAVAGVGMICNDGRQVATSRSTAVPCETTPGGVTSAGVNQACVSVRGLDTFSAVTNNFANPTTPSAMLKTGSPNVSGKTVEDVSSSELQGVYSACLTTTGVRTLSCYLRAGSSSQVALRFNTNGTGSAICPITGLTQTSTRYSCSTTVGGTPTFVTSVVYPAEDAIISGAAVGSILVDQCQCEAAGTAGRRCDAASCAADVHTISTAGWPTTVGSLTIKWRRSDECTGSSSCFILDGRKTTLTNAFQLFFKTAVTINHDGVQSSLGPPPAIGVEEVLTISRTAAGEVVVTRDGTEVYRAARVPLVWSDTATLGARYQAAGGIEPLNGSFSRLSWSNK